MKTKFYQLGIWAACILMIVSCAQNQDAQDPWTPLFNGKDLEGWTQKGGEANYTSIPPTAS